MNRRIIAIAMASVLSLSAVGSLHAAPLGIFRHAPSEKQSAGKMISFNIRNDSKQTMVLKAGDQQYTVEPGKSTNLKAQEGSDVLTVNGTAHEAAGTVLTKVTKQLQGNTLAIS